MAEMQPMTKILVRLSENSKKAKKNNSQDYTAIYCDLTSILWHTKSYMLIMGHQRMELIMTQQMVLARKK